VVILVIELVDFQLLKVLLHLVLLLHLLHLD